MADNENITIVEVISKAGACILLTNEYGETALQIAIYEGHKNVTEYLLRSRSQSVVY